MAPREFVCEGYRFTPETGTLSLHYAFDTGLRFEERIVFPAPDSAAAMTPRRWTGCSACCCWRAVSATTRHSHRSVCAVRHSRWIRPRPRFFTDFYVKGLGEFAWRNGIDLASRLHIVTDARRTAVSAAARVAAAHLRAGRWRQGFHRDDRVPEAGRRTAGAVLAGQRRADRGDDCAGRAAGDPRDAQAGSGAVRSERGGCAEWARADHRHPQPDRGCLRDHPRVRCDRHVERAFGQRSQHRRREPPVPASRSNSSRHSAGCWSGMWSRACGISPCCGR